MLGQPMFDLSDAATVMTALDDARRTYPDRYVKLNAFDATRGVESVRLSFIVNRPTNEPGFALERAEGPGRVIRYTTRSYATDRPPGERYR